MIRITANTTELTRWLTSVSAKQIPFAAAKALTETAKEARAAVVSGLDEHFTIRRTWIERGIRIVPANKRDWPNPAAMVGTKDDFMARQEFGGIKTGRSGKSVADPLGARPEKTVVTPPSKWPGGLLKKNAKRKFFLTTLKTGRAAGLQAVVRRDTEDRYPLRVMYLLKPNVKIKPSWGFVRTVFDVTNRVYGPLFLKAFDDAISSPRRSVTK